VEEGSQEAREEARITHFLTSFKCQPDRSNAIDLLCSGNVPKSGVERQEFEANFEEVPAVFTEEERETWLQKLSEVAVSSDAFFPFADNVYRLSRSGVKYAAAPSGSVNDEVRAPHNF